MQHWTTSAATTLAAVKLFAFIWFCQRQVSYYYTTWFITFVQSAGICCVFFGDALFKYIPFVRRAPDIYYDLSENPALTLLVVYILLPMYFPCVCEEREGHDRRREGTAWGPLELTKLALASVVVALLAIKLAERRDQIRRFLFPALRRGGADFRVSEKGAVGRGESSR